MKDNAAMHALAFGIGSQNAKREWLEVYYPKPVFKPPAALVEALARVPLSAGAYKGGNRALALNAADLQALAAAELAPLASCARPCVLTLLETDAAPQSTPEAYLKLHLLSHRHALPNAQNLDGLFALLPNVAWTDQGAVDLEELEEKQLAARAEGRVLEVAAVDKFPKMTNYVVPKGVRIAHSARVRLGAYLGEGTTVMHEGFVNFNAGALGPGMIEGRVSQGVTVGPGSDLGGSASTAGTLSGGGKTVISIGKDCLISANAGTGIPLGDNCTIEAGLYITPGTLVELLDDQRQPVQQVKARALAGASGLLFIRNSVTGAVQCRTNRKAVELNKALHRHN